MPATLPVPPREARERLVTLVVEGVIVLVPCAIWYARPGPLTRNPLTVAGLVTGALVTAGALIVLIMKAGR